MAVQQSGITSAVQGLAVELLPRAGELAQGMGDHLYAANPKLRLRRLLEHLPAALIAVRRDLDSRDADGR